MPAVFLIGGGRDEGAVRASHAPFVRAAGGGLIAAIVLDQGENTDPDRWTGALAAEPGPALRRLLGRPAARVAGLGSAYRVTRDGERLSVTVQAGAAGAASPG